MMIIKHPHLNQRQLKILHLPSQLFRIRNCLQLSALLEKINQGLLREKEKINPDHSLTPESPRKEKQRELQVRVYCPTHPSKKGTIFLYHSLDQRNYLKLPHQLPVL